MMDCDKMTRQSSTQVGPLQVSPLQVPGPGSRAIAGRSACRLLGKASHGFVHGLLGLVVACGTGAEDPSAAAANGPVVDSLLAEAAALAARSEAAPEPAAKVAPLDSARTLLYQAMSYYRSSDAAMAVADGRRAAVLQAGDIDRALRRARMDACRAAPDYACVMDNALEAARATVPEGRDLAYRTVALAQARLGDVQGALATASHVPGFDPGDGRDYVQYPRFDDLRVVVAAMQARTGDPTSALATADRLDVFGSVWREIVQAFRRQGDETRAARIVARRESEVADIADDLTRARAYVDTGIEWADMGQGELGAEALARAQAVAADADAPELRASALVEVATAWARAGDAARAKATVAQALSLLEAAGAPGQREPARRVDRDGRDLASVDPRNSRRTIETWLGIGEAETLFSLAEYLRFREQRSLRRDIIVAQADPGTVAAMAADSASVWGWRDLEVASALAKAGDVDGAAARAQDLPRRGRDHRYPRLVTEIAMARLGAGDLAGARGRP